MTNTKPALSITEKTTEAASGQSEGPHLSHHPGDVLLVLGREVGCDLHQQGRFVRSLQGIPLLQHLQRQVARDGDL